MRILAAADIHDQKKAMQALKKKAKEADVFLIAGDFTLFENDMERIIKDFSKMHHCILIIQGNHETADAVEELCEAHENVIYLDCRGIEIDGYFFLAIEGNGFARKDEDFEEVAEQFLPIVEERRKAMASEGKELKVILMTHAPPYNTKLDDLGDAHCGNQSVKRFIKQLKPDVAISGHIHECSGKEDTLGKTRLINPGPSGKIIDL